MNTEIKEISRHIYNLYGTTGKIGLNFFYDFREKLKNFDAVELLIHQAQNYPRQHVIEFFMSTPYLWENFYGGDWVKLLRRNTPRPDPWRFIDEPSNFVDIEVLERYLGVKALELFLCDVNISENDKNFAARYFWMHPSYLERDQSDTEQLDGDCFVSNEHLIKIKSQLLDVFFDK
jgi:hypothetical protein